MWRARSLKCHDALGGMKGLAAFARCGYCGWGQKRAEHSHVKACVVSNRIQVKMRRVPRVRG
jgi:hypothetical protein